MMADLLPQAPITGNFPLPPAVRWTGILQNHESKQTFYLMVLPAILLQQQKEASREDLYKEVGLLLDTHGRVFPRPLE